jgi:hypothetical protein
MTKRWEQSLRTLNDVPAPLDRIRDRASAGPRGGPEFEPPPRRQRVVAGVVAFAVFAAVGVFAWRAFDPTSSQTIGVPTGNLPTLSVKLQSAGFIDSAPDSSTLRVDTVIDYGDAHEESFTSTIPDGAIVDWVGVDSVTPFVPGPTVGSTVSITADGYDARVLVGAPQDWPNFGRFDRIDRLPMTPGDYVLLFEADYPEGTAMTARRVQVVEPGVLQLSLMESSNRGLVHATAYVDGHGINGFLSERSYTVGDLGGQVMPQRPVFDDQRPLVLTDGSRIILGLPANKASAGLVENYEETPDHLPVDLLGDDPRVPSAPGASLLAVDAIWTHGKLGYSRNGTKEKVRFFFPIEVVPGENQPSSEPSLVSPAADVQEFSVGEGAGRLAFAYGSIWVAEPTGVIRVDPATGEVFASIEVPGITPAGTDLPFSQYGGTDQGSSIAPAAGLVWVTAEPKIVGIDPATNTVVTSVAESSSVVNIASAGDLLLVGGMAEGNGDVRLIDPTASGNIYVESRSAFLDAFPQVLATAQWYWAASGTVEQPPGASRWSTDFTVAQTISVPAIRSMTEAGGNVWMTSETSLYRFDTQSWDQGGSSTKASDEIEPELTVSLAEPSIVAGDPTSLWLLVTGESTSQLIELDPASGGAISPPISLAHVGAAEMIVVAGQPWITFRDEGLLVTFAPVG